MAVYLRYRYVHVRSREKGMYAIPISKMDQRFFPFQPRGSEKGYEHGFVSQVCVHVRSGRERVCLPFPSARRTSPFLASGLGVGLGTRIRIRTSYPSSIWAQWRVIDFLSLVQYVEVNLCKPLWLWARTTHLPFSSGRQTRDLFLFSFFCHPPSY
jgi:hypothetical protein